MSNASSMPEPTVLLDGLAMPESARWHEGRLWFAHWGAAEIIAVDLNGNSEVISRHAPKEVAAARVGEVVISKAPAPGVGWP